VDSIGEKLRAAREGKKLTIKDVVKDTNINPIYLTALEEEKFDKFPSETYLIGFLRSYAEYLKLDVEGIVQSYKGYKIGESATPLEELTKPTKSNFNIAFSSFINKNKNILFICIIAVVAIFVIWGIRAIVGSDVDVDGGDSIEERKDLYDDDIVIKNVRVMIITKNTGMALVYRDEAVQFLLDKKDVVFLLRDIKEDAVVLELPGNKMEKFVIDTPRTVSIEGSSREVTFTVRAVGEDSAKIKVTLDEKKEEYIEVAEERLEVLPEKVPDTTCIVAQNKKNLKIIFEAQFNQKSYIELYLDGVQKRRGFIPAPNVERWEATEYIQMKIGNAGGIKARINGKDYTFGGAGQVANKVITWKKDVQNPNRYCIVVKDW
jgi:transcriptional regulator with XRE-family HTH domain